LVQEKKKAQWQGGAKKKVEAEGAQGKEGKSEKSRRKGQSPPAEYLGGGKEKSSPQNAWGGCWKEFFLVA